MAADQIALQIFGSIGIIIVAGIIISSAIRIAVIKSRGKDVFKSHPTSWLGWIVKPNETLYQNNVAVFGVNPGLNIAGVTTTRWDVFYLLRSLFGLIALVYCSYCIQDMMTYPSGHPCMQHDAYLQELFIAFIVFVIILFFVNTLTAYQLSWLLTGIMRYFVPLAALALSGTIVYYANDLSKISPQQLVE